MEPAFAIAMAPYLAAKSRSSLPVWPWLRIDESMRTSRRIDENVSGLTVLELTDPRWGKFVAGHPLATPFHHPGWASLVANCYNFRAFAVATTNATGEIRAGLPVIEVRHLRGEPRWVSLPFTDYCPPLVSAPQEEAEPRLCGTASEPGRGHPSGGGPGTACGRCTYERHCVQARDRSRRRSGQDLCGFPQQNTDTHPAGGTKRSDSSPSRSPGGPCSISSTRSICGTGAGWECRSSHAASSACYGSP